MPEPKSENSELMNEIDVALAVGGREVDGVAAVAPVERRPLANAAARDRARVVDVAPPRRRVVLRDQRRER